MRDDCITVALRLPQVRVVREEETETEMAVELGHRASSARVRGAGNRRPRSPQRQVSAQVGQKAVEQVDVPVTSQKAIQGIRPITLIDVELTNLPLTPAAVEGKISVAIVHGTLTTE